MNRYNKYLFNKTYEEKMAFLGAIHVEIQPVAEVRLIDERNTAEEIHGRKESQKEGFLYQETAGRGEMPIEHVLHVSPNGFRPVLHF